MYPILLQYWKSLRKRCCVCEEFTAWLVGVVNGCGLLLYGLLL